MRDWLKIYEANPAFLGQDKRGKKATGRPKSFKLDQMTLEEQNEYLRMENDILKKIPSAPQNIERALKFRIIDELKAQYSISLLCPYL